MANEVNMTDSNRVLDEVRRVLIDNCATEVEGRPQSTSEYGTPYKTFSYTFVPKTQQSDPISDIPRETWVDIERAALLAAVTVWKTALLDKLPSGALTVLVWRRLPELNSYGVLSEDFKLLKLRFRAHYMTQVDYLKGPLKPVENTA